MSLDESFEHSVPSGKWFRILVNVAIEHEGKKLGAFPQGLYAFAQKNGDAWSIVNRDLRERVIMTSSAAMKFVETLYAPKPLEDRLSSKVKGVKADMNPAIAEWMRSEDQLSEETIIIRPEDAGWFEGTLTSQIMREGKKLSDFYKKLVVAVRKEGDVWHVVNHKGGSVRLTQKAYARYVDAIYVPKLADPIEAHQLDAIVGGKKKPPIRVESREAFCRELQCYLAESYA
jgi:hypothetical protein